VRNSGPVWLLLRDGMVSWEVLNRDGGFTDLCSNYFGNYVSSLLPILVGILCSSSSKSLRKEK